MPLRQAIPMESSEKSPTMEATAEKSADEENIVERKITPSMFIEKRRTIAMVYVFDLREPEVFASGSLAGAYNLPMEFLETNLHRLPFTGDMLFYDGGEGLVLQAEALLLENAFTDFFYVEEGYGKLLEAMAEDPNEILFDQLSQTDQARAIEKVLDEKVRDFLARDGGGLEVMGIDGDKVHVAYQGACGGCPSSTAGTLRFIESTLTLALNHPIEVILTEDM